MRQFDSRKGATWHCVVGRNFGSFVTHGELGGHSQTPVQGDDALLILGRNETFYLLLSGTLRYPPFQDSIDRDDGSFFVIDIFVYHAEVLYDKDGRNWRASILGRHGWEVAHGATWYIWYPA